MYILAYDESIERSFGKGRTLKEIEDKIEDGFANVEVFFDEEYMLTKEELKELVKKSGEKGLLKKAQPKGWVNKEMYEEFAGKALGNCIIDWESFVDLNIGEAKMRIANEKGKSRDSKTKDSDEGSGKLHDYPSNVIEAVIDYYAENYGKTISGYEVMHLDNKEVMKIFLEWNGVWSSDDYISIMEA